MSTRLALVLLLLWTGAARAQQVAQETNKQVVILVRALAYDRNLKARAGDALVIGVLGKVDDEAARSEGAAVTSALRALGGIRVQGLPLRAVRLAWVGAADLEGQIVRYALDGLYVTTGMSAEVPLIREICRKRKVLSLSGSPGDVRRGLALGVFLVGGRSEILVNLPESREEGADLGAELLRLAEVLR